MDQKPNECNRIRYQECFTVLCVAHWQWSSTLLVLLLLDRSSSAIEGPCCSGRCSRTHQTTHEISPNTMQYHRLPYNTMHYHAIRNTISYHQLPFNTKKYHAIHNTKSYNTRGWERTHQNHTWDLTQASGHSIMVIRILTTIFTITIFNLFTITILTSPSSPLPLWLVWRR